jgi:hypothetical protein
MSQELMDWTVARHEALLAVLALVTAECLLSDEPSSVLSLTGTQMRADAAAATLAKATEALPRDRKPVGWSTPAVRRTDSGTARRRFAYCGIRCLSAGYAGEHSSGAAESEYGDELLCIAARDLAEGTVA